MYLGASMNYNRGLFGSGGVWVVIVLVFLEVICIGPTTGAGGYAKDYISWDDLKVDSGDAYRVKFGGNNVGNTAGGTFVVDKNGGGHAMTVQGAVDLVPEKNSQRVKIYIRPGIYREKVYIPPSKPYISFIGDEDRASETVITWHDKAGDTDENGKELGTYRTATVSVDSDYFCATGITFQNTVVAVPGSNETQAVALKISGDKAMFYRVRVLGTQDTLLDNSGTHYFYESFIQGTVDFIFGNGKSVYQDCTLNSVAKKYGAIAAQHRQSPDEDSGFYFVNCKVTGTGTNYLGRAWGAYSRVVYAICNFDDIIDPKGWHDWNIPDRERTVEFAEYDCKGKGADREQREPWSKSLSDSEAKPFLNKKVINGEQWLRL